MRMTGASQGDHQQRIDMLERELSQLKEMVKMRWQERTPRILSGSTIRMVLGKTDAAITKGSSGTVSIWTGTAGSESDSTENITVYNKIGNIAITKWCICAYFNNAWYLVSGEC